MRRACGACGLPFEAKRDSAKFCSDACRQRAHRSGELRSPLPGGDVVGPRPCGRIEHQIRQDIDAVTTAHPMAGSLAEMSINLARALDAGLPVAAVAAVNRELRSNLAARRNPPNLHR